MSMSTSHRVLVVDDEPNILDVLSMALRYQGFEIETAATGEQALAAAASFKPQLIVLDVMLPDMEGFEVARRLGAQRAGIPIIFLTARDATEDKVRGLTLGGDDYVTKPFSLEELIAASAPCCGAPARPGRSRAGSRSRTSSSTTTRVR
jgi:two-component system OmpR family response regulator